MNKLANLKKAAADKLAAVHQDVTTYISALKDKMQSNKNVWYGVGAAVAVVVILLIVYHLKHS